MASSQKSLVSIVAYGDREDFLQFLRLLPSRREGKRRRNCKRESCRGSASAPTQLLRSPGAGSGREVKIEYLCELCLEGSRQRCIIRASKTDRQTRSSVRNGEALSWQDRYAGECGRVWQL